MERGPVAPEVAAAPALLTPRATAMAESSVVEAGAGTKKVEMFGDLACGWSQVAWRWLSAVADDRGLDVAIRPFSLLLRDGIEGRTPQQIARRSASLRALRVLTGLDQGDAQRFWDAVAQQDGPVPFTDLAGAMEAAGGPADAVAHADDEQRDRMIVEAMAHVERLIGPAPKIPVLVIDERVAFAVAGLPPTPVPPTL